MVLLSKISIWTIQWRRHKNPKLAHTYNYKNKSACIKFSLCISRLLVWQHLQFVNRRICMQLSWHDIEIWKISTCITSLWSFEITHLMVYCDIHVIQTYHHHSKIDFMSFSVFLKPLNPTLLHFHIPPQSLRSAASNYWPVLASCKLLLLYFFFRLQENYQIIIRNIDLFT